MSPSDRQMEEQITRIQREIADALPSMVEFERDPLVRSVASETVFEVCSLLDQGADPNTPGSTMIRPIELAVMTGRLEVCAILLDAGADPSLKNENGATARDVAVNSGRFAVASFLELVGDMRARGLRMNPGHSFLEIANDVRKRESRGKRCEHCGAPVPEEFDFDHVSSHVRQVQLSQGASLNRPNAARGEGPLSSDQSSEGVIAEHEIWNGGIVRLTDRAIYAVTFSDGWMFPGKTGSSVPLAEIESTGYHTTGDPNAVLPGRKVHHVTVRGHMGLGGMDIPCKSEAQASEVAAEINAVLARHRSTRY